MRLRPGKLKELRERKFLTQQQLADKAGITKPNLSRLENGRQGVLASTVLRLAEALDVAPEELVEWGADTETSKAAA